MPHATIKLNPGVNTNRTPALNEASISSTNLVRFMPDKGGLSLVQKLGGWTKFYPSPLNSTILSLLAWEDTNAQTHLGVGCSSTVSSPTTAAYGNGTTATILYSGNFAIAVGSTITVAGIKSGSIPVYNGTYTTVATPSASFTASISGTTLTISSLTSGSVSPGQTVSGTGVTACQIVSGAGLSWQVSVSQTVSSSAMTSVFSGNAVSFSSISTAPQTVAGTVSTSNADSLFVLTNGSLSTATGRSSSANIPVSVTTLAGSAVVTITAAGSNIINNDSVYIQNQISVGGLILFGTYNTTYVSSSQFSIIATDILGNPVAAKTSVTNLGVVPNLIYSSTTNNVNVYLPGHGYSVGGTFTVLVPTVAGGSTVYGNYLITNLGSSTGGSATDYFQISIAQTPSSSGNIYINGNSSSGNAYYTYFLTPGPTPTGSGYGVGGYGAGGYGLGSSSITSVASGVPVVASEWTLDNWGEILVSCPTGGAIYEWSPENVSTISSYITNAPTANDGIFVAMPQRQIIAWGSTFTGIQDPLLIRWCDVNNYTSWVATVVNQAGSYRIPKGSRIVGCIQGPQQGLIWTDLGVWAMQYCGPPYVYQFNEIGNGCGLISRKAAASMSGVVYWMSQNQFYMLGSGGVQVINCPIWDVVFQNLNENYIQNIRVAPNSYFGEISWYYPSNASTNGLNDSYVKYNVLLDQWDYGSLGRTAWINQSVFGAPIGASSNTNYIYQHETSPDADGSAMVSNFQTGFFEISEGEYKIFVDQVWPDMKYGYYGQSQSADLQITFYVTDYPEQTPQVFGPYDYNSLSTYLTPRFRGRLMAINIQSSDLNSFWRIGAMRYRFQPDGKF